MTIDIETIRKIYLRSCAGNNCRECMNRDRETNGPGGLGCPVEGLDITKEQIKEAQSEYMENFNSQITDARQKLY